MDILSTLVGFLVGIVTAGFAVELGLKKLFSPPESSKLTTVWSLSELPQALVVAKEVRGVDVPRGARVVTATPLQVPRDGFEVRKNGEAHGNFAVSETQPRALLFLGAPDPGSLALWTVDEKLIERLRAEFHRLWTRSTDYVEKVKLADVAHKANLTVSTGGVVQGVVPYKGHFLVRLTEEGETVGVLVDQNVPLEGTRVEVVGIVRTSGSGYPLIEAIEIRGRTEAGATPQAKRSPLPLTTLT